MPQKMNNANPQLFVIIHTALQETVYKMSLSQEFDAVLALITQSRLLAAKIALDSLNERLTAQKEEESERVQTKLHEYESLFAQLEKRVKETNEALESVVTDDTDDSSWTLGMTYLGITTHYRTAEDGCITVKLEGTLEDNPLFEQAAVIHEFDLFETWVPFCNSSKRIMKVGAAELVGYMSICIPPLGRDHLMRAYASDCLLEAGKLVLRGGSIASWPPEDPVDARAVVAIQELSRRYNGKSNGSSNQRDASRSNGANSGHCIDVEDIDVPCDENGVPVIPWKPTGWFQKRMQVKEFTAVVELLSPTTAKTIFIACVNPNAQLPQALINYIIRNLAGLLLYLFQCQVKKVAKHADCTHAHRIRENLPFYKDWMLPKLRAYCDYKGWPQPTIVSLGEYGLPPSTG